MAGAVCHQLPHLTPTVGGAALLCYRCLGIYGGMALAAGYLVIGGKLGRGLSKGRPTALLALWLTPLVLDEVLVTLGVWDPPPWWRVATGVLGGTALMALGIGLLGASWRRARARREGMHLGELGSVIKISEAILLPPALCAISLGLYFPGGIGLWTLEALGLLGVLSAFTTAGALLLSSWPPLTRKGWWGYGAAAVIIGLAAWTVLWMLRGCGEVM